MACLQDIQRLFNTRNPFYAGFGNRITDALSYRSVDVPSSRIFTIDAKGDVKMELLELAGYKSSCVVRWAEQTDADRYIAMTDLVDQIPEMGRDPAVECFADIQRQLRSMLGKRVWARLERVATGDGMLSTEEQLRDYGSSSERVRGVMVQGFPLHGAELFRPGPSVSDQLLDIEIEVAMTLDDLRRTDVTTREIRLGLVKLGELMRRIEEQRVRLRAVNSFFEIYNLGHLAEWVRAGDPQFYIGTGTLPTRLVVQRGTESLECAAPEHYRVPGQSLVALMRDTVTAQKRVRRVAKGAA